MQEVAAAGEHHRGAGPVDRGHHVGVVDGAAGLDDRRDPGLDRKMMILLRKIADKGHTILLVTHDTNNINVCDAICFLANGGRLAYYGPAE